MTGPRKEEAAGTNSENPDERTLLEERAMVRPGVSLINTHLGRFTEIGEGSRLLTTDVGDYSYCDRYCDLANATIGKFSNIAAFVRVGAPDHPLDRASLHHFMYRSSQYWRDAEDDEEWFTTRGERRTTIGHDTWLGHAAQVKPGVVLGDGAVVAAGAVVTKHVDPYHIVAGVPAKVIRVRQPKHIAERLQQLAWWNWPHATLRKRLTDFRSLDVHTFLERYGG